MSTSKSLGDLLKLERTRQGIDGTASNGRIFVEFLSTQVVKVATTTGNALQDFSYATVAKPEAIDLIIEDSSDKVILKSAAIQVIIRKHPVLVSFLEADGRVINEDDSFGTSWIGEQVTTYKKLQPGERFVGLGEKTGGLDRRGHGYQNWNTDSFAYNTIQDPLYTSIPFYIGIHSQLVYGIFLDNSHKSFFNFGASNDRFSSFSADAGEMIYYFIAGGSVAEIIQNYTWLTGRMELPPLWSIGYQQCRYSYYPDTEVLSVARSFREKEIPSDVIVLDIHYMQDYKIFTWSEKNFPNPKQLIERLKEMGFRVIVICDPGIKVEPGYHAYDDGLVKDVFLKYPDNSNYSGQVWPGWCHFPDFTNSTAREWWAEKLKDYVDLGIEGFWNDMNEIATWGNMVPDNIVFDLEGKKGTMREGRNLYGLMMARSSYEAAKKSMAGKRPFNLTRSGFAGIQRYSAVWTGDNVSYDDHMLLGVRMVNSMGLSGVSFAGYDIGGFVGESNSKLYTRWLSIGAFSPFFRGHTMINSRDAEPWSFGEEAEQIARNFIRFRYQLLPYIYSLFYDSTITGMPAQRSLAIDYPNHHKIYDYANQYLFGPSILVCPVESTKDLLKVYLPEGTWYSLYDGHAYEGNQEIIVECPLHKLPVFVKGGAIIPMQPPVLHTGEMSDELNIHIYYAHTHQEFGYYEDDGVSYNYQTGAYHYRVCTFDAHRRSIRLNSPSGELGSRCIKLSVVFHGFHNMQSVAANGVPVPVSQHVNRFFSSLEKFDPVKDPTPAPEERVQLVTIQYPKNALELTW